MTSNHWECYVYLIVLHRAANGLRSMVRGDSWWFLMIHNGPLIGRIHIKHYTLINNGNKLNCVDFIPVIIIMFEQNHFEIFRFHWNVANMGLLYSRK